jgi:hypothetical protein
MTERESSLHAARVFLAEAARRRHDPVNRHFYWTLLAWVANERRNAVLRAERDLFGLIA